jgi:hypothetical protein
MRFAQRVALAAKVLSAPSSTSVQGFGGKFVARQFRRLHRLASGQCWSVLFGCGIAALVRGLWRNFDNGLKNGYVSPGGRSLKSSSDTILV